MKFEIIASPSSGKGGDSSVGDLREGLSASGQYELALGAFEEIGFDAESVREYTKQDIIYRKARTLIHTSEMSLLAKKCVNLCHFISGGMGDQEVYVVQTSFFTWMLGFASRNLPHLRKALREGQKASVELLLGDEDSANSRWVSVPLLSTTAIGDGTVRWRLPPEMQKELRSSGSKAYISMRVQSQLTIEHALTLYEIFSGFEMPCTTDWMTPDELREALGITHLKSYENYNALKRSVIDKSLKDINAKSDLHVELEVASRGKGKTITHLRFHAKRNKNYMIGLDSEHERIAMQERYRILTEDFGLSDKELELVQAVMEKDGERKVDDAIEFAKFRIQQGEPPVKYPGAFLMSAISEGRRLGAIERDRLEKTKKPPKEAKSLVADNKAEEAAEKAKFEQAVVDAKRIFAAAAFVQLWAAFAKTLPGKSVLKKVEKSRRDALALSVEAWINAKHDADDDRAPDPELLAAIDGVLEEQLVCQAFGQYLIPHLKG